MTHIFRLTPLFFGLACSHPSEPEHVQRAEGPSGAVSDWKAVIVWQTASAGAKHQAWFTAQEQVSTALKSSDIFVTNSGEAHVEISKGNVAIPAVECTPFLTERFGYVFAMGGKAPAFQPHDSADVVLSAASVYFGVAISPSNP
ncbi:MAG: hypothetical protein GWP91_13090 [Rhodobacterales bacterium]|nr:hypothetical protein [Rhodobacterales bacterium]